jgi:Protein of unknown function (DUF998)
MAARVAGVCGLIAFVTMNVGWIAGGLAQPDAYSSVRDDISDLGATTANDPWLYNQIGANLTGLLVIVFGLGLWRVLSPDVLGRIGSFAVIVTGTGAFLDGLFRLDCRGIDSACRNDSWHSHAHKIESGFTAASLLLAPPVLAFAFRRRPEWRDSWLPSLLTLPATFAAGVLFSLWGNGASTRAATVVGFIWIAFMGVQLIRKGDGVLARQTERSEDAYRET